MKTKKFLSMAALALVGAMMTGCSNDDNYQQPENKNNVVTLTTTIGLDDGGTTRAVSNTGVKTFGAGDQMAVIYKNTSGGTVKAVGTLTSGADTKSGTFTFTLTAPDNTKAIRYIYPAAMAKDVATDATIDDEGTVDFDKLNNQDGTLTTLGSTLDLCTLDAASWTSGTLPTGTLANQLAILAITLKDNAATPAEITGDITGMTINDGTNDYAVTREAVAGPIYVAIRPTSSATINITATDGSNNYAKTLATTKTYEAGNGYSVSWRMAKQAPALNLTSPTVGQVIGDDGKNYDYASLPGGVTAVAKICYVSGEHGLALALADEGSMDWSTAISTCAAHTPAFTGGTWLLASQDQWNYMMCTNGAGSYTALRDGFTSVGGSNLESNLYWSSSERNASLARYYSFHSGSWSITSKEDGGNFVRSCLAF